MAKKVKKKVITNVTPERAEQAFGDFATADARISKINADMDVQFTKIREKYAEELARLDEERSNAIDIVQAYAMEGRDTLFAKRRSIDSVHGTFGFRLGTPQVKPLKGLNWPIVTENLKKQLPGYIRTKIEPAKDKLLADREKKGMAEKLAAVGLRVIQTETFFIDRKTEEESE